MLMGPNRPQFTKASEMQVRFLTTPNSSLSVASARVFVGVSLCSVGSALTKPRKFDAATSLRNSMTTTHSAKAISCSEVTNSKIRTSKVFQYFNSRAQSRLSTKPFARQTCARGRTRCIQPMLSSISPSSNSSPGSPTSLHASFFDESARFARSADRKPYLWRRPQRCLAL